MKGIDRVVETRRTVSSGRNTIVSIRASIYDSLGRCVGEYDLREKGLSWEYVPATLYRYDSLNRQIEFIIEFSHDRIIYRFVYDSTGQYIGYDEVDSRSSFGREKLFHRISYDDLGREIAITCRDSTGEIVYYDSTYYNSEGLKSVYIRSGHPVNNGYPPDRQVLEYDENKRLVALLNYGMSTEVSWSDSFRFEYYPDQGISRRVYFDYDGAVKWKEDSVMNQQGQLQACITQTAEGVEIARFEYKYDEHDRLIEEIGTDTDGEWHCTSWEYIER